MYKYILLYTIIIIYSIFAIPTYAASSNIIEGEIVHGTTSQHFLKTGSGQWMEVQVSSIKNNAVFDLAIYKNRSGKFFTRKNQAKSWYGKLPSPGWSKNRKSNLVKITLGSTGGYADYTMTIKIDSYDWKD